MNFVNCDRPGVCTSKAQAAVVMLLFLLYCLCLPGCSDEVYPPSAAQLTRFQNAGPGRPKIDVDRLVDAKLGGGPHRVLPGEVIEFTMPTILQIVTAEEPEISGKTAPHISRVSDSGTITLPVAGELSVEGKTLAEIEQTVIAAYYPEYTVTRPSVFARILEYKTARVSITGAVKKPGIYSLRSDQLSVVGLLMEAEGIVDEGAGLIRIIRPSQGQSARPEAESDQVDINLRFRQQSASSTRGELTLTAGQQVLFSEELDIASRIKRQALLHKLARTQPGASIAVVNERLCSLAELLGSSSDAVFVEDMRDRRAAPGKLTSPASWDGNVDRNPNLHVKAVLPKMGYGPRENQHGTASASFGFYDDLGSEKVRPASVSDGSAEKASTERTASIARPTGSNRSQGPASLVLPIEGLNIPFADVALQDGDRVIVERLREPMITVVGLVNRAGNFPYPPDVEYNLMHALGFAGGLNLSAEPRYATIYRLASDGTTVSATFNVAGIARSLDPTDALSMVLKPYDVVAVEHTPRTRAKVFWDRVFRFYVSTYVGPDDIFGD